MHSGPQPVPWGTSLLPPASRIHWRFDERRALLLRFHVGFRQIFQGDREADPLRVNLITEEVRRRAVSRLEASNPADYHPCQDFRHLECVLIREDINWFPSLR